jgi:hypothetical protein
MEQTVLNMEKDAEVTVIFADGRIVSGYPVVGPGHVQEGEARELYVVWPRWWSEATTSWIATDNTQGLVINLDETAAVMLSDNPLTS